VQDRGGPFQRHGTIPPRLRVAHGAGEQLTRIRPQPLNARCNFGRPLAG
jgi:hypothetical protein